LCSVKQEGGNLAPSIFLFAIQATIDILDKEWSGHYKHVLAWISATSTTDKTDLIRAYTAYVPPFLPFHQAAVRLNAITVNSVTYRS